MTFWKAASVFCAWLAVVATIGLGALTAQAQDETAPAAIQAQPVEAQPAEAAAAEDSAPAIEAQPAAEAAVEPAPQGGIALTAKDLPIGTAVFGADGAKIGEVNRVTSESDGSVVAIHVTTGGKAGLGAEAVVVPADKIAGAGDGVKLSLSAAQVKSLPSANASAG